MIMHYRRSLLFYKETAWTKKNHSDMSDVTVGSFDGAEVCALIGLFLLNNLSEKYGKNNVGLYRDDGLALLRIANGPQSERNWKGQHSRIQETWTEHFYKHNHKSLQLPRPYPKPHGRNLLSTQKAQ